MYPVEGRGGEKQDDDADDAQGLAGEAEVDIWNSM